MENSEDVFCKKDNENSYTKKRSLLVNLEKHEQDNLQDTNKDPKNNDTTDQIEVEVDELNDNDRNKK